MIWFIVSYCCFVSDSVYSAKIWKKLFKLPSFSTIEIRWFSCELPFDVGNLVFLHKRKIKMTTIYIGLSNSNTPRHLCFSKYSTLKSTINQANQILLYLNKYWEKRSILLLSVLQTFFTIYLFSTNICAERNSIIKYD